MNNKKLQKPHRIKVLGAGRKRMKAYKVMIPQIPTMKSISNQ